MSTFPCELNPSGLALPILLSVEDSDAEFFLVERALRHCPIKQRLLRAEDGEEAIRMLNTGAQTADDLPNVVLLDINMPKKGGFEVLEFIRTQTFLNKVCVVMFSSSLDALDRKRALSSGADDFISKPIQFEQTVRILTDICAKYFVAPVSTELHYD